MIVFLARDIQAFVMYCINGTSRSSLLIESVDSMIMFFPNFMAAAYFKLIIIYKPSSELRKAISALGLPQEQLAGHSFRIGAATAAALAGVEDSTIQLLGRWSSASFRRYIRTPPGQLAALSARLAGGGEYQ